MFPERERIPAFKSVLQAAQEMKLNNHSPSPEFMQELFEVVRLARPQQDMVYPLLDLIFTVASLDLSQNSNNLLYWRSIVVSAILMLSANQHSRGDIKDVLNTLCSYLNITVSTDVDALFTEVEQRRHDPEWLLCNIEYRLGVVGDSNFEIEYQIAHDLMHLAKRADPYTLMLANSLTAEVCMYYTQNQQAFVYGQQALAIADYLDKPLYKLGALMAMLPYTLSLKSKLENKPLHNDYAKKIIHYWEQNSEDWKTPRQEALFLAMVGPFYISQQYYESAERYLKKAVQII
jgi:hypothetical protein